MIQNLSSLCKKHCKQLTAYAFMLQFMAAEAGVHITQDDLDAILSTPTGPNLHIIKKIKEKGE